MRSWDEFILAAAASEGPTPHYAQRKIESMLRVWFLHQQLERYGVPYPHQEPR